MKSKIFRNNCLAGSLQLHQLPLLCDNQVISTIIISFLCHHHSDDDGKDCDDDKDDGDDDDSGQVAESTDGGRVPW